MRREAERHVQELLQSLDRKSATARSGAGAAGAQGSISSAMKAKLQNAVRAMQEGLVERDTEVGCQRMRLCSSKWQRLCLHTHAVFSSPQPPSRSPLLQFCPAACISTPTARPFAAFLRLQLFHGTHPQTYGARRRT